MVRVGADTKDMEKGLKTARAKMKAFGKQMKQIGKVAAVAGAAVVGAIGMMVRSYVKAGDEIHKMALRTGFSTEALSALKYAADISGASLDDLEKGVKKMSKTISDASKAGGALATYVRAFDRIGLSAEDLIALSPEKQFEKITRAIADLESPTLRAALAQEIFGRAGTKLLPLMAEGAEGIDKLTKKAEELGLVWSQEAANAAAKLNDSITTLKGSFTGLSRNLVTELVPALTVITDHFTETFVGLQDESKNLASMIVTMFGSVVGAVGGVLKGLKAFYISMIMMNKMLAEGLIAIVEAIELTAIQTGNLAVMMKVLPWTAEALEKLNKTRELNIESIKKEEEGLLKLTDVFKDLLLMIDAASRAQKTFGETITESVLPPARDLLDVLEKIEGAALPAARSLGDVLGQAVTEMTSPVYEYKKAWQETMYEILSGVSSAVGAMDSVFGQFHANEAQRLADKGKQETDALEAWYEREQARIERTITNEEEKVAALEALDEEKARKENTLQVKMDKEKRKLARAEAKAKKVSALFAAGMNVAEAITKALTAGPLIGQIFAAIVAGLGAVQMAAIAAAPLPSLAKGGMIEKEGIYRLHPGEEVRSAAAVKAQAGSWTFSPTVNIYTKYLDDRAINQAAEKIFRRLEMERGRY